MWALTFLGRRGLGVLLVLLFANFPSASHDLFARGNHGENVPVQHFHVCQELRVNFAINPLEEVRLIHRRALTPLEIRYWIDLYAEWARLFGPDVIRRSPPTNKKNCHGKTFDSGRSWIDDPIPFLRNCTSIEPPAVPGPGDVAVYIHGDKVLHSGRVIEPPPEAPPGDTRIWVHSQWGRVGDFDHPAEQVPQNRKFEFPPGSGEQVDEGPYGKPFYYSCP